MKQIIILLVVASTCLSFKTSTLNKNILGKWVGTDKSEIGYITFKEAGEAYFEVGEQIYGGEEFEVDGKLFNMYYTSNFEVQPFEIDFVVTELDTKEVRKMICIGEFIDENSMNFAVGFDDERPTDFEGPNAIVLTRVNE
jgi:hypothetical protein